MISKEFLLKAALSGFSAASLASGIENTALAAPGKKAAASVHCYGVNSCKGQNGCAVSADQIKASKEAFGDKYAKSKSIDCAGNAECASKNGILAWASKPNEKDCFAEGGFVFEKKGKTLVIKNKDGVVKKG